MTRLVLAFFIGLSTLCLELLLTRILAFVYWHHVVYLIVTLALLGYGAASSALTVHRSRLPADLRPVIAGGLLLYAGTAVGAVYAVEPMDMMALGMARSALWLVSTYLVCALPFFFAGVALVCLFLAEPERAHRLYAADLVGAALGCGAFVVGVGPLGAPRAVAAVVGLVVLVAGPLCRAVPARPGRWLAGAWVLDMVVVVAALVRPPVIGTDPLKTLGNALSTEFNADAHIERTEWDVVARVDVVAAEESIRTSWGKWGRGSRLITFDGDAVSAADPRTGLFPTVAEQEGAARVSLANALAPGLRGGDHLVIGLGGGVDIARSLALGAAHIDAVDINAALLRLMSGPYAQAGGGLFTRPEVRLHHSDGRSFLRRAAGRYHLIQMTGVDTFTAMSTGAYVLAENYLYTVEAVMDYYRHLAPGGVACIARWFFPGRPRETLRLVSVALEALRREGVAEPHRHIVVTRGFMATTCIRRDPLTDDDVAALRLRLDRHELEEAPIYLPSGPAPTAPEAAVYAELVTRFGDGTLAGFLDDYEFDVSPVTDDRPFFFSYYKLGTLLHSASGTLAGSNPVHGYWPYLVFGATTLAVFLAVLAFILVPLLSTRAALRRRGGHLVLAYFGALGLGFMMLEIAIMQHMALFVGHPMYSISAVLGSMLLFTGVGSALAERSHAEPRRFLLLALAGAAAGLAVLLTVAPVVMSAAVASSLGGRLLAVALLVAPLSVCLGTFFPTGLRLVSRMDPGLAPWAWGINSGATVMGSILAIVLAMQLGFGAVFACAGVIYAAGCWAFHRWLAVER
ncbi:MAG: hypothetical protein HY904_00475 [Deltaproteobacteria bacterium]|nr:hypothetical protein [Deltaproteobacteria bacterium]